MCVSEQNLCVRVYASVCVHVCIYNIMYTSDIVTTDMFGVCRYAYIITYKLGPSTVHVSNMYTKCDYVCVYLLALRAHLYTCHHVYIRMYRTYACASYVLCTFGMGVNVCVRMRTYLACPGI